MTPAAGVVCPSYNWGNHIGFASVAFASAVLLSSAASAQLSGQASARNPEGLVRLLQGAGYSPELGNDSFGDPSIEFELGEYKTTLIFFGCDETTRDRCNSVQLRAGFDRAEPWTAAQAIEVSKKYRFASIWLDDEGDPWVQWDIMTGDGIPAEVFLDAVELFSDTLEDTAEMVLADE